MVINLVKTFVMSKPNSHALNACLHRGIFILGEFRKVSAVASANHRQRKAGHYLYLK